MPGTKSLRKVTNSEKEAQETASMDEGRKALMKSLHRLSCLRHFPAPVHSPILTCISDFTSRATFPISPSSVAQTSTRYTSPSCAHGLNTSMPCSRLAWRYDAPRKEGSLEWEHEITRSAGKQYFRSWSIGKRPCCSQIHNSLLLPP